MGDDRRTAMMVFRVPEELRDRLREMAAREQRSVSSLAVRAMRMGLDQIERERALREGPKTLGDEFERAVVGILIAHGLLSAAALAEDERPKKPVARKKVKNG